MRMCSDPFRCFSTIRTHFVPVGFLLKLKLASNTSISIVIANYINRLPFFHNFSHTLLQFSSNSATFNYLTKKKKKCKTTIINEDKNKKLKKHEFDN